MRGGSAGVRSACMGARRVIPRGARSWEMCAHGGEAGLRYGCSWQALRER